MKTNKWIFNGGGECRVCHRSEMTEINKDNVCFDCFTNMNKQHTPTPWKLVKENKELILCPVEEGNTIYTLQEWPYTNEANARHIVHCVNRHDLLIETLTTVLNRLEASGKFPSTVDLIEQALSKESEA